MSSNKEKIIEAAEKLEAQGVNPTQVTVREALGGGSFATIGPILKEWKESKKEDHALTEIQVPEEINDRLEQLKGAVWQAAVGEAERRLSAEREALKAAHEQSAVEVAEHLESIKALEVEAEEYQRKIELQDEVANSLDVERHNALTELSTANAEHKAAAHAALDEIAAAAIRTDAAVERAQRAESLHDTAQAQARGDLADLKKEHKADTAALKADVDGVKTTAAEEVKQADIRTQEQARRAERAEKEAQQRGAGELACQSRLEAAQREAEQMTKRMEKLEEKASKAIQEAAELRGEIKALKAISETKSEPKKRG